MSEQEWNEPCECNFPDACNCGADERAKAKKKKRDKLELYEEKQAILKSLDADYWVSPKGGAVYEIQDLVWNVVERRWDVVYSTRLVKELTFSQPVELFRTRFRPGRDLVYPKK